MIQIRTLLALSLISPALLLSWGSCAIALPPPEEKPEEVLRTEVITGAISPLDGKPVSAVEYAKLQAELRTAPPSRPEVAPKVREQVSLLRLRKFIKTFFPFIPIR